MAKASTSPRFEISDEVMSGIESHAYSLLTAEVGGMLMGRVDGPVTKIVGFIPALSASAEQVTLTFTHDVWEDILKLAQSEFPKESIVGWYHTHPTFGVFLSDYDLFIQENFFAADGHLALVIDPVQGIYGWFAKNKKGAVEVFEEGATKTGPKRSIDPVGEVSPAHTRKHNVRTAAVGLVGILVGFAVGGGVALAQIPPDLSSALESSKAQLAEVTTEYQLLQQGTSKILSDPVLQYVVQPGDTVASVAERFYYKQFLGRSLILRVNGLSGLGPIPDGTLILIPSPTKVGVTPYRTDLLLEQLEQSDSEPGESSKSPEPDDSAEDRLEIPAPEEAP
jgi:proteasome lid subunit RPN8/RPN11/LysM repeat protein